MGGEVVGSHVADAEGLFFERAVAAGNLDAAAAQVLDQVGDADALVVQDAGEGHGFVALHGEQGEVLPGPVLDDLRLLMENDVRFLEQFPV